MWMVCTPSNFKHLIHLLEFDGLSKLNDRDTYMPQHDCPEYSETVGHTSSLTVAVESDIEVYLDSAHYGSLSLG